MDGGDFLQGLEERPRPRSGERTAYQGKHRPVPDLRPDDPRGAQPQPQEGMTLVNLGVARNEATPPGAPGERGAGEASAIRTVGPAQSKVFESLPSLLRAAFRSDFGRRRFEYEIASPTNSRIGWSQAQSTCHL